MNLCKNQKNLRNGWSSEPFIIIVINIGTNCVTHAIFSIIFFSLIHWLLSICLFCSVGARDSLFLNHEKKKKIYTNDPIKVDVMLVFSHWNFSCREFILQEKKSDSNSKINEHQSICQYFVSMNENICAVFFYTHFNYKHAIFFCCIFFATLFAHLLENLKRKFVNIATLNQREKIRTQKKAEEKEKVCVRIWWKSGFNLVDTRIRVLTCTITYTNT